METSEKVSGARIEIYADGERIKDYMASQSLQWGFRHALTTVGTKVLSAKLVAHPDGPVLATFSGPTIEIVAQPFSCVMETNEATDIGLTSMRFRGTVDSRGNGLSTYYFEYGTTSAYGSRFPAQETRIRDPFMYFLDSSAPPLSSPVIPLSSLVSSLQPGTEYHYRLVVRQVSLDQFLYGPDMVATTLPNQVPVAKDDIAVLKVDGTTRIEPTLNDTDDNWPLLQIAAASAPAHGTVTIENNIPGSAPRIHYVADASFETVDEFTYTVRDPYGAEATARVVVRSIQKNYELVSGDYATAILDEDLIPIGSVTVTARKDGKYTGAVTYRGQKFPFSSAFAPIDGHAATKGQFEFGRPGFEPLRFKFTIWPNTDADGAHWISGDLQDYATMSWLAEAPQLLPLGVEIPEAGQFNVALPNPEALLDQGMNAMLAFPAVPAAKALAGAPVPDADGIPKGHGFSIMKMSPRGQLKIAGRLGDNIPFASAARMRRDRKVQVLSTCGVARGGRLHGVITFDVANGTGGNGTLTWSNSERSSGIYRAAFKLQLNAEGNMYRSRLAGKNIFAFPEGVRRLVQVTVRDHADNIIALDTMELSRANKLDSGPGRSPRLRIAVNPMNGQYKGTLARPGQRTIPIIGLVRPAERRGLGVAGLTGFDGTVEISAI